MLYLKIRIRSKSFQFLVSNFSNISDISSRGSRDARKQNLRLLSKRVKKGILKIFIFTDLKLNSSRDGSAYPYDHRIEKHVKKS